MADREFSEPLYYLKVKKTIRKLLFIHLFLLLALLPTFHSLLPAYVLTPNSPSSVLVFGYSSLPYCVTPRRSTTVTGIPDCSQPDGQAPPTYVHNHCTLSL